MATARTALTGTAPGVTAALLVALGTLALPATAAPKECRGNQRNAAGCTTGSVNLAPVIGGTPVTVATVGIWYSFRPSASDPEGKALSFSISNKPPWASFDSATGRLSGTPAATAAGEYIDIVIRASDGSQTAALAPFAIVVRAANRSPSIGGTPATAARENQAYEFIPTVADPDGDALTFSISNRPAWATFDPATGRLSGTPPAGSVGNYSGIAIRVSDGQAETTLPAFAIAVTQVALGSATLSWVAPTMREDGSALINLAGYRIKYGTSAGSFPNQLQISNPGITSCVIENLPPGTYYFTATAYDANGNESRQSAIVSKTIS